MTSALRAAHEVAGQLGLRPEDAVVLQETNNTVVWLRPEPVIAKVATRPNAKTDLRLEHAIGTELAALRTDIAAPLPGVPPVVHPETSFVVTFWQRLDGAVGAMVAPDELVQSLRGLHLALAQTRTALPTFRTALTRARAALDNDSFMAALAPEDRLFLRQIYDDRLAQLDDVGFDEHRSTEHRTTAIASSPPRDFVGSTSRAAVWARSSGTSPSWHRNWTGVSPMSTSNCFSSCASSTALGSLPGAGRRRGSQRCVDTASSTSHCSAPPRPLESRRDQGNAGRWSSRARW